jgi:hypothetical protein
MTIAKTLRQAIAALPVGEPFVPAQFLGLASRASIDQTLTRLTKSGDALRVSRGVYVCPKQNQYVGVVMPEPAAIARAVARAQGAEIQVHGADAARRLELTTQVPMQLVYYTNGCSRRLQFGRMQIRLQHANQRRLTLAGRPAGVALCALRYLGRKNVSAKVIAHIRHKLPPAEFEALQAATAFMPAWLAEMLVRESRSHA